MCYGNQYRKVERFFKLSHIIELRGTLFEFILIYLSSASRNVFIHRWPLAGKTTAAMLLYIFLSGKLCYDDINLWIKAIPDGVFHGRHFGERF